MRNYTVAFDSAGRGRTSGCYTRAEAIRKAARSYDPSKALAIVPRGEKTSALKLARRIRAALRAGGRDPLTLTLRERRKAKRLKLGLAEIKRRGLTTCTGWDDLDPRIITEDKQHWVLYAEGWFDYKSRGRWRVSAAYLCGHDEGQLFAVRVPASCSNIQSAIDAITPGPVRQARDSGKTVIRQGDMFFVARALRYGTDLSALRETNHTEKPTRHGGYNIVHPEHKAVRLSSKFAWVAYQATQINFGGSRRPGD